MQPLLDTLGLGTLIAEPQPVTGGLIHRMWRVSTDQGAYALKQLNPTIMTRPRARSDILAGERIAREFAGRGLPAVAAVFGDDGPIHRLGADSVMIFEWVDGTVLDIDAVTVDHCRTIGLLIARMHQSRLTIDGLTAPSQQPFDKGHWDGLMGRVAGQNCVWRQDISNALPMLHRLSEQYADALLALQSDMVVSHRDLDVKNVLWRSRAEPAVIDWEAGGLVNPMWELIDAALNWYGQATGQADKGLFQAFISSYRSVQPLDQAMFEPAFIGCLGARMEWLEFNMQRSLDNATPSEERHLADREVVGTILDVLTVSSSQAQYQAWFNEANESEID